MSAEAKPQIIIIRLGNKTTRVEHFDCHEEAWEWLREHPEPSDAIEYEHHVRHNGEWQYLSAYLPNSSRKDDPHGWPWHKEQQ